jgi:hypothetical protein
MGGATRLPGWTCPLCGRRTARVDALRHGVAAHPATLPTRMTITDRLRLIPALAREVALTMGAPNPTSRAEPCKRTAQEHPPLPIDVAALDVLACDDGREADSLVPVVRLVECSRRVWEAFTIEQRAGFPQPVGVAFGSECAWLASAWPEAQSVLDPSVIDWIDSETRDVCSQLAAVARLANETRYRCPDCGESLHLGEGGWMVCEAGAHMHPGPDRLVAQWRRRAPMSTNHLAAQLHITTERIRKWHERGKLHPTRQEGRTLFWLPWDVVRCLYPDVVAAIEAGETAPDAVTIAEASAALDIPIPTLHRWRDAGAFERRGRRGNAWLFSLADIRAESARRSRYLT